MNGSASFASVERTLLFDLARAVAARRSISPDPEILSRVDWLNFFAECEEQGLFALACEELLQFAPAAVARQIHSRRIAREARSEAMMRELGRVCRAFAAAGIPLLVFKGGVLAFELYGATSARSFSDLDLIVDPRDAARGEELLRTLGYSSEELTPEQQHSHRTFNNETVFVDPVTHIAIDFHWAFTNKRFPFELEFRDAWARRRELVIDGETYATLGDIDLILLNANHAAKHLWSRVEYIVSIGVMASWSVDWNEVDRRAAELHARRQVGLSFSLASELLGTPLPALSKSLAAAQPFSDAVHALVRTNLFSAGRKVDAGGRDLLLILDRRRDAMRSFLLSIFTPTFTDWRAAELPRALSPLYWLFRPVRLAVKYATGRHTRGRSGRSL